jgi:hypothetical protein
LQTATKKTIQEIQGIEALSEITRILSARIILLAVLNISIALNVALGGILPLGWQGKQDFSRSWMNMLMAR